MCVQGIHVLNVKRFPDLGKEFFLGNQGALLINQVFQDLRSLGAQVSNSHQFQKRSWFLLHDFSQLI